MTYSNTTPQGYLADYVLTRPVNTDGKVKGFELTYEQPIGDHFGINANYTYADGRPTAAADWSAPRRTPTTSAATSRTTTSTHASTTRTAPRSTVGLDRATAFYQDDTDVLNASFGFKATDWLNITLDALNLNEPKLKYYALNKDQPRSIYQNGRQYYLNFRFKF